MSLTEGMDVERVRTSAREVVHQAGRIARSRTEGRRVAARLAELWQGQDAQKFQHGWRSAERSLEAVEEGIRAVGTQLLRQAEEQERVSAEGEAGPGLPGLADTGGGGAPRDDQSGNPAIPGDSEQAGVAYETIDGPVYDDGVEMADVSQGALGDCWFVASMMSLARTNPELIDSAIVDNGDGTYDVTLYDDGEPVVVTVTNEPPAQKGDPAYADNDSGTRELWPMLLEKAAAQHLGGDYDDIVGDTPERGLELLTGAQAEVYADGFGFWDDLDHPPAQELYDRFEKGESMIFSTRGDDKSIGEHELVGGHAYVIAGVSPDGDVTLQNPWGVSGHPPITVPYEDFERYSRRLTIIDA